MEKAIFFSACLISAKEGICNRASEVHLKTNIVLVIES